MSDHKIRLKVRKKGGNVIAKVLISHPMETGLRKNPKTGEFIPANFIQKIIFKKNGQPLMNCFWGRSVSENPYLSFKFKGEQEEEVSLTWLDNLGQSGSVSTIIK